MCLSYLFYALSEDITLLPAFQGIDINKNHAEDFKDIQPPTYNHPTTMVCCLSIQK